MPKGWGTCTASDNALHAEEGLANAFYFLIIISWEQLPLDLKVNVDSIPVLHYSHMNKLRCYYSCLKIFMDFIVDEYFLTTKYFQTTVLYR